MQDKKAAGAQHQILHTRSGLVGGTRQAISTAADSSSWLRSSSRAQIDCCAQLSCSRQPTLQRADRAGKFCGRGSRQHQVRRCAGPHAQGFSQRASWVMGLRALHRGRCWVAGSSTARIHCSTACCPACISQGELPPDHVTRPFIWALSTGSGGKTVQSTTRRCRCRHGPDVFPRVLPTRSGWACGRRGAGVPGVLHQCTTLPHGHPDTQRSHRAHAGWHLTAHHTAMLPWRSLQPAAAAA